MRTAASPQLVRGLAPDGFLIWQVILLDVADFSATLHQSLISERLLPEDQLKYASLYQVGIGHWTLDIGQSGSDSDSLY
jgi:hypothetical protein